MFYGSELDLYLRIFHYLFIALSFLKFLVISIFFNVSIPRKCFKDFQRKYFRILIQVDLDSDMRYLQVANISSQETNMQNVSCVGWVNIYLQLCICAYTIKCFQLYIQSLYFIGLLYHILFKTTVYCFVYINRLHFSYILFTARILSRNLYEISTLQNPWSRSTSK